MAGKKDLQHSILIVSSSEQFTSVVKTSLTGFITIDVRKSAAMARRQILERDYDIVVVNAPLPDEVGEEFALDAAERMHASVLMVIPREVYDNAADHLTDLGILVLPKPIGRSMVDRALRFLVAGRNRIRKVEDRMTSLEEKLEELRIVSRAKILLIEKKKMTEEEAHRHIGKLAMDHGVSRRRVAERLLDEMEH